MEFWNCPRFTRVISKFSIMHSRRLSQIVLPDIWLLSGPIKIKSRFMLKHCLQDQENPLIKIFVTAFRFSHCTKNLNCPLRKFSKFDQIRSFLPTWWHLLKKSLMEILNEKWSYSQENSDKFFLKKYSNFRDYLALLLHSTFTAQNVKLSIEDFFSKCDPIRRKLRICSNLLQKSLMENFIFVHCFIKFTD